MFISIGNTITGIKAVVDALTFVLCSHQVGIKVKPFTTDLNGRKVTPSQ